MRKQGQVLNLGQLLRQAQKLIEDELLQRMRERGYEESQPAWHHVFFTIESEGSRLTDLAARASLSLPAMWEIVDDLEAKGYVERQPDPTDRRAKLIRLTAQGRKAVRQGRRAGRAMEADYRRHLGAERFEELCATLRALLAVRDPEASG
jgi:DNA-binding MarR family transcriptional regulator